jgi:uncharacterized membrane protein
MNKLVRYHPRLWIAMLAGIAIFLLLPARWSLITRVLVGWNCGVMLFLVLIYAWMISLTAKQICSRYIEEDSSAPFILIGVTLAAVLSLIAIVDLLATIKQVDGTERIGHLALAFVTLTDSWLLVPTMFTTFYADMFYSVGENSRPMRFPETDMPVFWDFAYFSFTIAAACQTADVLTTRGSIRSVVIAHELISLLFQCFDSRLRSQCDRRADR